MHCSGPHAIARARTLFFFFASQSSDTFLKYNNDESRLFQTFNPHIQHNIPHIMESEEILFNNSLAANSKSNYRVANAE